MKKNDEMTKVMKKDTKKSEDKDGETDTEMVLESDREEDMDTGGTERSQTDESLEGKRRTRLVKKRKTDQEPELSPVQSGAMDAFLAEVEKLCKEVELIKELSEKNANTKIKIKEKARYLVNMTKKVATLRLKINQKAPPVPLTMTKYQTFRRQAWECSPYLERRLFRDQHTVRDARMRWGKKRERGKSWREQKTWRTNS